MFVSSVVLVTAMPSAQAADAEPLHVTIDRLIEQSATGPVAGEAEPATLLRRLHLHLHGVIPSPDDVRSFHANTDKNRYKQTVQSLVEHPRYARHMANVLDVMWMERRAYGQVAEKEWQAWLLASSKEDRPYDEMVAEMLESDGSVAASRTPSRFVLERSVEPNLLTRDIGRVFFGRDLQCAQCHDHPLITHYRQSDYYGLYAFFNRSYAFDDKKLKKKVVAEKPDGDTGFESVFTGEGETIFPRLPGGTEVVDVEPAIAELYKVRPAKDVRPVPTYSRRQQLAAQIRGGNRIFARTLGNRLWAHMFGQGLVHPVDLDHPENPPVHPAVLDALTDAVIAADFRLKPILVELAMTRAYRRKFDAPKVQELAENELKQRQQTLQAELGELDAQLEKASTQYDEAYATRVETSDAFEALNEKGKAPKAALKKAFDAETASKTKMNAAAVTATTHTEVHSKLLEAAEQAKAASAAIGDDSELAAVVAGIEKQLARVATLKGTSQVAFEKLEKEVADLSTKTAAQQKAVDEWKSQLSQVAEPYRVAREKYEQTNDQFKSVEARRKLVSGKLELVTQLLELRESRTRIAALSRNRPTLEQQVASRRARSEAIAQEVGKAVAQDKVRFAELQAAKNRLAGFESGLEEVQDSLASVKAAIDTVSQQSGITQRGQIVSQLETAAEALNSRKAAMESRAAQAIKTIARLDEIYKRESASLTKVQTTMTAAQSEFQSKLDELAAADQELEKTQQQLVALESSIHETAASSFQARVLSAMTPEQLAWSVMQATGVLPNQIRSSEAELDKQDKEKPPANESAADRTARLESAVFEKLKANQNDFVKLYGAAAGQPQGDFFATVDQALFFSNGGRVVGWLNPSGSNLTARVQKLKESDAVAEELYLSVLSRFPSEEETAEMASLLTDDSKQNAAVVREMVWALLSSAEFRFNH